MTESVSFDYSKYDFKNSDKDYVYKGEKGLSKEIVEMISAKKNEPEWMHEFRLRSYDHFLQRPLPEWGANLNRINFNDIYY